MNMQNMKIIITYGSAGAGHKIAARAIEQALANAGFDGQLKVIDILEYMPGLFKKIFSSGYLWTVTRWPWLWYAIYENRGKLHDFKPGDGWKEVLLKMVLRRMNHHLINEKPDYIISTFFTASWLAGRYKYLYNPSCKIGTIITDYGLHPVWICPNQDRYFVPNESDRYELAEFSEYTGVGMDKIEHTGIPVEHRFTIPKDKMALREKYGFAKDRFNILLVAGVYGYDHVMAVIEKLANCKAKIQINVAAQTAFEPRTELKSKLEAADIPVNFYGRIGFLDELMALSDIAITKTGGLTSTECLSSGCPLFIYLPYPGQEERNSSVFTENQAGMRIYQLESLAYKVDLIAGNPVRHKLMVDAASGLVKPDSAAKIAELVLSDLR